MLKRPKRLQGGLAEPNANHPLEGNGPLAEDAADARSDGDRDPSEGEDDGRASSPSPLRGPLYGPATTFGTQPWWGERGWWKLTSEAEANDVRADVGTHGPVSVAAVTVRGNKHRLSGAPNQDAFAVSLHRQDQDEAPSPAADFVVVAVSDGMGSAEHSHFSSRLVAYQAARELRTLGDHVGFDRFLDLLRDRQAQFLDRLTSAVMEFRAGEFQAPRRRGEPVGMDALQCTLTFALVPCTADANGGRTCLIGFVGDSPAFRLQDGVWNPIEPAKDHDGLWSSSTQGVLGAQELVLVEVSLGPGDSLLVSSDGIGNFLTYQGGPTLVGADLARRWVSPVGLHEFICDASFEMQSADDDRTAVMVWFRSEL